uniref:Uncharacterized protein n=1 Tax=Steinernema glaseri TaxID=37863 RepID=A0A1I8ANZ9_9BILA
MVRTPIGVSSGTALIRARLADQGGSASERAIRRGDESIDAWTVDCRSAEGGKTRRRDEHCLPSREHTSKVCADMTSRESLITAGGQGRGPEPDRFRRGSALHRRTFLFVRETRSKVAWELEWKVDRSGDQSRGADEGERIRMLQDRCFCENRKQALRGFSGPKRLQDVKRHGQKSVITLFKVCDFCAISG